MSAVEGLCDSSRAPRRMPVIQRGLPNRTQGGGGDGKHQSGSDIQLSLSVGLCREGLAVTDGIQVTARFDSMCVQAYAGEPASCALGNRHGLPPVLPGLCWPTSWLHGQGAPLRRGVVPVKCPSAQRGSTARGAGVVSREGPPTWVGISALPLTVA